jgi:hypothetical protein
MIVKFHSKFRVLRSKFTADECDRVSEFVRSQEGAETQKRLWNELSVILERIQPDIMSNI